MLKICDDVFDKLSISHEQAQKLEEATRNQHQSKLWFKYRAGRVTASHLKAAVHTDVTQPSQSLIKQICYPESRGGTSEAQEWGLKNEKTARDTYCSSVKKKHLNFTMSSSGLVVHPEHPHLGASPDGVVSCEFSLNLLANGTLKPPFTDKLKMHMTIATVQLPVLTYQRWMLLPRTVTKLGAIVEERMKGRRYFVTMMLAKLAGFIPSALSSLLFQRERGFARVAE